MEEKIPNSNHGNEKKDERPTPIGCKEEKIKEVSKIVESPKKEDDIEVKNELTLESHELPMLIVKNLYFEEKFPKEYEDVFPEETPHGLPPIRGIEHQIDFVPGATIPNRPAYMSDPDETKELQRQVSELLEKGYVRESMSPCAIPVILVPKKDETLRMRVDCRAINNITVSV
ncbi:hypothetical protein CRG98_031372 [Punica granatum]|uniref:Reverse transcriptase domain-containing protein n=1 Tax=Punica granatum TaxID=22663 RepID=A0A2I0IW55_PUNGR|nr:hypothetical protein CRG98_031372 [Punica granatum]